MTRQSKTPQQQQARLDRVWIEIEPSDDHAVAHARAAKASAMMKRLGVDVGRNPVFFWSESDRKYCVIISRAGTYYVLGQHGYWFDLDTLAAKKEAP